MGGVFHTIHQPYVGFKHEANKSYHVAYKEAVYVWNEGKLEELRQKLKGDGHSENGIESMMYYNSQLFIDCVDREVQPVSSLYWRVRAVFALYGPMEDSKTGKPLFNREAWVKAKGVLKEILQ